MQTPNENLGEGAWGMFIGLVSSITVSSVWPEAIHALATLVAGVLTAVGSTIAIHYTKKWLNK